MGSNASSDRPIPADYRQRHTPGYPALSYFLGMAPQSTHLRRFSAISMRNLLYLQHELQALEIRLLEAECRDSRSGQGDESSYAKDFSYLKLSAETSGPHKQYDIFIETKEKIKEYEDALLRNRALAACGRDVYQIKQIQSFLARPDGCDLALSGVDSHIWGSIEDPDGYISDLIAIFPARREGPFARYFIERIVTRFFHLLHFRWKRPDPDGLHSYRTETLSGIASAIANAVASLLVYIAIVCLNVARSAADQLIHVCIFIAVFSFCLAAFDSEKFGVPIATFAGVLGTLITNNHDNTTVHHE